MGVVSVNKEEAMTAGGLFRCLLIEDFDPFNTYLPIRPSLLGVTNTSFKVSFYLIFAQLGYSHGIQRIVLFPLKLECEPFEDNSRWK